MNHKNHGRVVVLASDPQSQGGVASATRTINTALENCGWEVITLHDGMLKAQKPGKITQYIWHPLQAWKLVKYYHKSGINADWVFAHGGIGWSIKGNLVSFVHGTGIASALELKKYMSRDGYLMLRYTCRYFDKLAFNNSKIVLASSETVQKQLHDWYGCQRTALLENAVDISEFKPYKNKNIENTRKYLGLNSNDFVIVFSGNFSLSKGSDVILKVANILTDIKFLILTPSINSECIYQQNIIFKISPSRSEITSLYNASDLFILPSRYEGCSISVIEAMACCLPCIITRVGHADTIARREPQLEPLILDVESSITKYVNLILSLKNDKSTRELLGELSRQYAVKYHSIEFMASRLNELIKF